MAPEAGRFRFRRRRTLVLWCLALVYFAKRYGSRQPLPKDQRHGLTWVSSFFPPWSRHPDGERRLPKEKMFADFWTEVPPRILLVEISVVVLLTAVFETWEKWVRKRLIRMGDDVAGKILDVLFKEFTGLGFIGLLLYLVTQSGAADLLAQELLGRPLEGHHVGENPLADTFETVHMMIFLLLVVLLFQATAILHVSSQVAEVWSRYEQTRSFGERTTSFESMFVHEGYLTKRENKEAPRGFDLVFKRPFTYGTSWWERLLRRRSQLVKTVMWRALRHEFLFPAGDGRNLRVPIPALFSFKGYLCGRLSKTVLHLVEVSGQTWMLTVLVLIPTCYALTAVEHLSVPAIQCMLAWMLFAAGSVLTWLMEEDTYMLTPAVPQDARNILQLFLGTNTFMLRRRRCKGGVLRKNPPCLGCPGLSDYDPEKTELGEAPARLYEQDSSIGSNPLTSTGYKQLVQTITFWQAICVTSLIISYLSETLVGKVELVFYCFAWVEWPMMLFFGFPLMMRRLTIRNSVDAEADHDIIRTVSLDAKESLLRYHTRLVQLLGFGRRSIERHEPWAIPPGCPSFKGERAWTKADARAVFGAGVRKFENLSRPMQTGIWHLFETWDTANDGNVRVEDIAENLQELTSIGGFKRPASSVGYPHFRRASTTGDDMGPKKKLAPDFTRGGSGGTDVMKAMSSTKSSEGTDDDRHPMDLEEDTLRIARTLLRYVDFDETHRLTWDKCKALGALAIEERPRHETEEDLETFFAMIDKNGERRITVFQLTEFLGKIRSGMTEEDVGSLLYRQFGQAKPTLTYGDFYEWMTRLQYREGGPQPKRFTH